MLYRDTRKNLFEYHDRLIFIDSPSAVDEILETSTIAVLHKNQFKILIFEYVVTFHQIFASAYSHHDVFILCKSEFYCSQSFSRLWTYLIDVSELHCDYLTCLIIESSINFSETSLANLLIDWIFIEIHVSDRFTIFEELLIAEV